MALTDLMLVLRHDAAHHDNRAIRECAGRAVVLGDRDPRNAETALKMLLWAEGDPRARVSTWAEQALATLWLAEPVAGRAAREVRLNTPQEEAVIGHLRGWCHDAAACNICQAEERTRTVNARLDSIISG